MKTMTTMKNQYIYNKIKGLLMLMVLLTVGMGVNAQTTTNNLVINDFEGGVGKTVSVPIYLENADEVVTAQFDIELPFAVPSDGVCTLSNRSDMHSVSFSSLGSNKYRVVIINMENRPLRGNAGLLLRMPMKVDANPAVKLYPIIITSIVLTDDQGNNIATDNSVKGYYSISYADLPDLTVSNISILTQQCAPGGLVRINYDVKNIGTGTTRAGWTEKLYLESTNGTRTYIGSQTYESVLAGGATAQRTYEANLPTLLHMDGEASVVVEVVPTSATGELTADQGNNTGMSEGKLELSKRLLLTTDKTTVREGNRYGYATFTLSRSGDWSLAETFTISCSVNNLMTCNGMVMPCTVTIPARTASATLRIAAVDDDIVRAREADITVEAVNGYEAQSIHLKRVDDDVNPLTLTASPASLNEGDAPTLTATRGGELSDELTLRVSNTKAGRFDKTMILHFNVGEKVATASSTVIEDDTPQLDATVSLSVSANDYRTASTTVRLNDDDRPALTMTLSRSSVIENMASDAEAQPLVATISRDRGLEQEMTVWLTSSRNEVTFELNKVVIPVGSSQVEVPLTVTDNSAVDGQRIATLTAALYLTSELRSAPVGDRANSQCRLTIVDDEEPYLTLSSWVKAVGEGASATLTVRRYMPSTSQPLTVTLSCDDKGISFSKSTITIPAGSTSATTTMNVARNTLEGDDRRVMITAKATGLNDGLLEMLITDRTLPDAVNPSIEATGAPFYSGLQATVRATIRNVGTSVLPKGMNINFYLNSTNGFYYYTKTYDFFQATTDKEIAVGDAETFEFQAQLPQLVGRWWIYARLNTDNKIAEFSTGNNLTQVFCPITIAAPFEVETVTATPEDCLPGSIVTVTGRMRAVPGSYLNGQTVQVLLDGSGQRTKAETKIDAAGNFNVAVRVDRSAYGYMTVKALAVGQTEPAKTTQVHVYNMRLGADNSSWTVDENIAKSGRLTLRNMSAKPITITDFKTSQPLPDDAEINFDTRNLGTIPAGGEATIPYTVKGLKPSAKRQSFTVTATSQEGLESTLTISYFCQATSAYLVFTPRELKTTMLFNADREGVAVKVKNCGKKASGKISEMIKGDFVMSDFGNNRTLQPGEETTLHLTLLAQDYMHVGRTYNAILQLTPENGGTASLPITVTATGNELCNFDLLATDVYGKAIGDYSHVKGAEVTVTNTRTGKVFLTGTIGSDGHWKTDQMKEGQYKVTLKANRHKTVSRQLSVGPGEDCAMTMLMPYRAVLTDFVVDQDLTTNQYMMRQYIDVDRKAPQGTIVAEIPDDGFGCDSETMEIVLRNDGPRTARNIQLSLPVVDGYQFTILNAIPSVMMSGDRYILQVAYTGPSTGNHRVIAKMRLHYEFDVRGETLSEEDIYQTLVGCTAVGETPEPPTVLPEPKPEPGPDDDGEDEEEDNGVGLALPTYNSWVKLEFEDLENIRCGQPLKAVLRVKNGEKSALRSLRFILQVSDTDYEDRTSLFTYAEGDAKGFTADGNYWRLDAQTEGELNLSLTPLASAAADGPCTYYIGGLVSYIDSRTGIHNSASMPLFTITVMPSGDVQLTYLVQHNFLGDDADTETIEDEEPAMMALLARNLGPVAVDNLRIQASQPIVVGNSSSRSVRYDAQYAAVDGNPGNYTYTDFQLDNIDGGVTVAAQWLYTSDVSAHVRSMSTLTDGVTVATGSGAAVIVGKPHELIRAVATRNIVPGTPEAEASELELKLQAMAEGNTYLVNDIEDDWRLPDAVMTAEGIEEPLQVVSSNSATTATGNVGDYTLTVHADEAGWVYGRLHDPTNGLMRLESVTRVSDGAKVSLANFWQTNRTPMPDYTMLQENLLHFADLLTGVEETYQLHFVARPTDDIRIMSVQLFTAEGNEVSDGGTTTKAVQKIQVAFNDRISRLFFKHLMYVAHGEAQDLMGASLQGSSDNRSWTLDLSALPQVPGSHSFTIDANKVKTPTGKKVVGEKTVNWTENLSGSALITINVAPDVLYGSVSPATGDMSYGQHTLVATPAAGYELVGWTDANGSGEYISTSKELTIDVWKAQTLTAHFAPVMFTVTIECGDNGVLKGSESGIYAYGEEVLLATQPQPGFLFESWKRDGEIFSALQSTKDFVKGNYHYVANFKENPNAFSIVLDENATTEPSSSNGAVNVTVKRTFKANEWSTICLPFAMNEAQLKSVFGNNVKVGDFTGYDLLNDGNGIIVHFNEVTAISANRPYIIKVAQPVSAFTVNSVVVTPASNLVLNMGTEDKPKALVGNYVNGTVVKSGGLFLNGGRFWYSVGRTRMQGYRAFFDFADVLPDFRTTRPETRVVLEFGDETTDVGELMVDGNGNREFYNLSGQRVAVPGKGVYVVNGRKVLVK